MTEMTEKVKNGCDAGVTKTVHQFWWGSFAKSVLSAKPGCLTGVIRHTGRIDERL